MLFLSTALLEGAAALRPYSALGGRSGAAPLQRSWRARRRCTPTAPMSGFIFLDVAQADGLLYPELDRLLSFAGEFAGLLQMLDFALHRAPVRLRPG